jgi:hypothetical protein
MISLRGLALCIVPLLTLTVIVWPHSHADLESAYILVVLLMLICALTATRLSKSRSAPDLRIPFFLNAAGGVALLIGFAAYSALILWDHFTRHAAH